MNKSLIWMGAVIGSAIGGWVPALWGVSVFSFTSIFWSSVGGVLGIVVAYKITQQYF